MIVLVLVQERVRVINRKKTSNSSVAAAERVDRRGCRSAGNDRLVSITSCSLIVVLLLLLILEITIIVIDMCVVITITMFTIITFLGAPRAPLARWGLCRNARPPRSGRPSRQRSAASSASGRSLVKMIITCMLSIVMIVRNMIIIIYYH